jgi:hypothetical protein
MSAFKDSYCRELIVSSVKLQQTCQGKLHFISACTSKSKHLSLKHREAYIEGYWLGLGTLNISFNCMTEKTRVKM